jgi:hypothetical protein
MPLTVFIPDIRTIQEIRDASFDPRVTVVIRS